MRNVSIVALLSAGVFVAASAFAQTSVEVSTEVSAEVSVSTPDVSSALSSVTSDVSSALSSVSSEVSSALSSVSSELSSAVSSASSEVSSALSSVSSELSSSSELSPSEMPSTEPVNCGTGAEDIDVGVLLVAPLDAAALAAVTSVTVIGVGDCSGLAEIDGSAAAALSTHPAVIEARAAAGETGGDIIAYTLSDGALTVYVQR